MRGGLTVIICLLLATVPALGAVPTIVNIQCLDQNTIQVEFSTELDPGSAGDTANYSLTLKGDGGETIPGQAQLLSGEDRVVQVSDIAGFSEGDLLTLTVDGLLSLSGEAAQAEQADFYLGLMSIAFARNDGDGDGRPDMLAVQPAPFVTVQGTINQVADFAPGRASLQDSTAGMSIVDPAVSALSRGDLVRISGHMGFYEGLSAMEFTRFEFLSSDNPLPGTLLTLAQYLPNPEAYEGRLVGITDVSADSGTWPAQGQDGVMSISDSSASGATLFISSQGDLDGSPEPAWPTTIWTIGAQLDQDSDGDGVYDQNHLLMPRDLDDLGGSRELCLNPEETRACYDGPPGSQNNPPCQAGQQTCDGGWWSLCLDQVVPLGPLDDNCDGVDDNCDGNTDDQVDLDDDGFFGAPCGSDCADDDRATYPGADELCDQVDNDCDQQTDEDFPDLGGACDSSDDEDLCPQGTWVCLADGSAVECSGDYHIAEVCDGLDNDCDGETDEDYLGLGQACDSLDEDLCATGEMVCNDTADGVVCDEDPTQGRVEVCSGLDDDCDGQTDEDLGSFVCGVGACQVVVDKCIDGEYQDCAQAQPSEMPETSCADGIDNDCDGFTDEVDHDCNRTDSGGSSGCSCNTTSDQSPALALLLLLLCWAWARRR